MMSQFCTCHNSWAVLMSKLLHHWNSTFYATAMHVFTRFRWWPHKLYAKWVPYTDTLMMVQKYPMSSELAMYLLHWFCILGHWLILCHINNILYIPRNIHMVLTFLYFGTSRFYSYSSSLLHRHWDSYIWGNHMIAPVSANTARESTLALWRSFQNPTKSRSHDSGYLVILLLWSWTSATLLERQR